MPETQSDIANAMDTITAKVRAGRPRGSRNKPDHKAGRPKKPKETFDEVVWQNGRRRLSVEDTHIAESLQRSSSACAIAEALKQQIPNATHVSVDLATIRWTDRVRHIRYVCLTPMCAQELVVNFDQGLREKLQPISFDLKPVLITRSGQKRRQVPDASELRGSGISPPAAEAPPKKLIPYAGKETRRVSNVPLDGTVPVVLGGHMPPISALPSNTRAFGLRQARK
jgi:hypothetical protein